MQQSAGNNDRQPDHCMGMVRRVWNSFADGHKRADPGLSPGAENGPVSIRPDDSLDRRSFPDDLFGLVFPRHRIRPLRPFLKQKLALPEGSGSQA
ncbi:MAG: hypothetical protein V2I74_11290 [Erythrobacter sp.]|jgi:hypothetical protein|nr:hypothetical protein [Erythrobacter sp.]